jgi:hypothetical protein
MHRSLDHKLQRILADSSSKDFILADAKDADMAYGIAAPGRSPEHHAREGHFRSLAEYRQLIRENVRQGLVDIMLMSSSTNEVLTVRERLFDGSPVTPAIRANDTTDVWAAQGGSYREQPSVPFRSAAIDEAMCGKPHCDPHERALGADLGLYSVTFNNELALDHRTLEAYRAFRSEAAAKNFRHFLEVFDPNAPQAPLADLPRYINDMIVRTLAGAAGKSRPLFLKVVYHGPAAMEQLAGYDSQLIVGILGGSSGTTFDAFQQLWEARKYGARAALYGRMINNAEDQLSFIEHLRGLADGDLEPREAVRSYHAGLVRLKIRPYRSLEEDQQPTLRATSYGGSAPGVQAARAGGATRKGTRVAAEPEPDFSKMTPAEKIAWNRAKWDRILG